MVRSQVETSSHEGLSIGRYALIYVVLLVLTVATFLFSRHDFGIWSMVIALAIAVAKASLVALFFMQLWQHGGTYRLAVATALLWVALMIVFILADVKTRFPLAVPSAAPTAGIPVHGKFFPGPMEAITDRVGGSVVTGFAMEQNHSIRKGEQTGGFGMVRASAVAHDDPLIPGAPARANLGCHAANCGWPTAAMPLRLAQSGALFCRRVRTGAQLDSHLDPRQPEWRTAKGVEAHTAGPGFG